MAKYVDARISGRSVYGGRWLGHQVALRTIARGQGPRNAPSWPADGYPAATRNRASPDQASPGADGTNGYGQTLSFAGNCCRDSACRFRVALVTWSSQLMRCASSVRSQALAIFQSRMTL